MPVMSVEEFRERDVDYLDWVAANRDGYVINIGRSGQASGTSVARHPPHRD
jgi:hypothetical protein